MKKILFILVVICFGYNSYSQNNVGIGTATPDPSALLELKSNNQGLLVPRTRIASISSPAVGLVIFDTDTNCFVLFNGTNWKNLCTGISGLTGPTGAAGAGVNLQGQAVGGKSGGCC